MATIHFLNVNEGTCSIIEHNSGHTTVIDVSNGSSEEVMVETVYARLAKAEQRVKGNYNQKKYPVNPVSCMKERGISSVFRYIQSHPDMDHMDGLKALFEEFEPANFGIQSRLQNSDRFGAAQEHPS